MSYGIKISKPDFDVLTTGDENLVTNSDNPALKIYDKGTGSLTITPAESSKTDTIPHNLGYTPLAAGMMEYYDFDDWNNGKAAYYKKLAFPGIYGVVGALVFGMYFLETDETNLYMKISFTDTVPVEATLNYIYFIYSDEY